MKYIKVTKKPSGVIVGPKPLPAGIKLSPEEKQQFSEKAEAELMSPEVMNHIKEHLSKIKGH